MRRAKARGFTLLELAVVVVVVVAATVLVVIPGVLHVRDRAEGVTCQGNLRLLLQAIQSYNVDHNGSMPYGKYFVKSDPVTWEPATPKNTEFVSWPTELNRYFAVPGVSTTFQCPEAQASVGYHPVSYVMNFHVAVAPVYEMRIGGKPPNAQTKPPSVHLMLAQGTAVMWDTPVQSNWAEDLGFLLGADVDGQRFWQGAVSPQLRYYAPHDPFGTTPPGVFGNDKPVTLGTGFRNVDPPPMSSYPYQGNLRFRHESQTRCNVAFSDGSVRQFSAVIGANNVVSSHDALRRYFLIHWPAGARPNPALPSVTAPPMELRPPATSPPSGPPSAARPHGDAARGPGRIGAQRAR
jgi:prepilin-type processing-associated H-X9-DG protein